ncbi:MAG: metallophosphoesterase [Minisyncoccia bacterium]|jgi:hypothetical protein
MPKAALISLFLLVAAILLYLGNLVVYRAIVLTFDITGATHLLLLGVILGFLSASFIASTIIDSWYYNFFTRSYYQISAVWLGFFAYIFFASAIYGIAIGISHSFAKIGLALFFVALLLGVYGVFHGRKIVVTKTPISLPNLPRSWRGRRMVWISDLHLGQIHGLKFVRDIVARVSALSPDIIFIGGDFYDGTGAPDIPELTAPLSQLSASLGTYFITGNHEEYGDRGRFISAVASAGIHVLEDEMIDIDGLQLIGVDYRNASNTARFKETLSKIPINRENASILLKHEPKDLGIAHAAGISFQISGHTHEAQLWPLGYITQLIYKGYAYGLKRFKDMQVYISSGTGTWGPPMRVGTNGEIVLFTLE